jgi:hypothetical protein
VRGDLKGAQWALERFRHACPPWLKSTFTRSYGSVRDDCFELPFDLDDPVGDAELTLEIGSAAAGLIRGVAGEDEAATT